MIYSWEAAQRQRYGFEEIDLTLDEAQIIVDVVWHDYIGGGREPPTVGTTSRTTTSFHSSSDHSIYLSTWGRDLDTVLHETTHAIIDAGGVGSGHDEYYAAQILDLWARYAPIIDSVGARLAAAEFGVQASGVAPVRARSSSGVDVVWSLICTEPVRSESYCEAFSGSMRTPTSPPATVGAFQPVIATGSIGQRRPSGDIGSYRWYGSRHEDDGTVKSWTVSEATIDESPDRVARLNIKCEGDELKAQVWWQINRGFATSLLVRFGEDEFTRAVWTRGMGSWDINGVSHEFLVANVSNDEQFVKDLMWAAGAGESFTMQIRSGADPLTTTFNLDGLFDTPVQPNLARCGR